MKDFLSPDDLRKLSPSPFLRKHASSILAASGERPILDVACGGGRNSILLAHLGADVIGVDIDLGRIEIERNRMRNTPFFPTFGRLRLMQLDLTRGIMPFAPGSIGGIVNVHFLHLPLLDLFSQWLATDAFLLLETIELRGENYRQLPKAGLLKSILSKHFSFLAYNERPVKKLQIDAVAVQLIALRR